MSVEPQKGHKVSPLSKRQRECLQGVADHLDSQQIAERVGISPHTVDGHIAAAVKVLGARSRRDAVRAAGLTSTGERLTGQFPPVDLESNTGLSSASPNAVREVSQPYDTQPFRTELHANDRSLHPYLIIAAILGGAVAIVVLLLALDPLVRSAANLANIIHPQ